MADSWGGSWGTSWAASWGAGSSPIVAITKDGGAGAGHKKKWKIVPLDEWLKLHHPEESVEERIEAVEEIAETIDAAPNPVVEQVYRELTLETARVNNLVAELKRESRKVSGLSNFLEEMAEYKSILESAKRKIRSLERNLREMDDEETLMLILDHA